MNRQIAVRIATAPETWGVDVTPEQVNGLCDRYEALIYEALERRYPDAEITVLRTDLPSGRRVSPAALEPEILALIDDLFQDPRVWDEKVTITPFDPATYLDAPITEEEWRSLLDQRTAQCDQFLLERDEALYERDEALYERDEALQRIRELEALRVDAGVEAVNALRERDEARSDRRHRLAAEDSLKARLEEALSLQIKAEDRAVWADRERDEARADAKQQDIWREQMAEKWREENIAHHKVLDKLDQALRELDQVREAFDGAVEAGRILVAKANEERNEEQSVKWKQEWAHADAQRISAVRERDEARAATREVIEHARTSYAHRMTIMQWRDRWTWLDEAMLTPTHEEEE